METIFPRESGLQNALTGQIQKSSVRKCVNISEPRTRVRKEALNEKVANFQRGSQ